MTERNQNPEQLARDMIDVLLEEAGWRVQPSRGLILMPGWESLPASIKRILGCDYVLFVDKKAVGVIEAKAGRLGPPDYHGGAAVRGAMPARR